MNSQYIFTRRRTPYCVFIGPIKFAYSFFHIWKMFHICKYRPPCLGRTDRAASSHSVRSIYNKRVSSSDYSTPVVTRHYCQKNNPSRPPDNPSEPKGEGKYAKFVFLV